MSEFRCAATKKLLVRQQSPNTLSPRSFPTSSYQGALPLSTRTLHCTARLIRSHRKAVRSRWRALDPGRQALLTLAYPHPGHTCDQLAPGFGIWRATAARRVKEVIDLLSAQAPRLRAGLRKAERSGRGSVIVDGTLVHTDRLAADRPYYQVKHRYPTGCACRRPPMRTGICCGSLARSAARSTTPPRPGSGSFLACGASTACSPSPIRAARAWTTIWWSRPTRGRDQKAHHRLHARLRGPGERVFAELKKWRVLHKLRCYPHRATHIARAIATPNHQERQSR